MKKYVILSFSSRNNGNCSKIASFIQQFHAEDHVKSYVIDQRIGPCNSCDYECLRQNVSCPNVSDYQREVMTAVMESDRTYLIVPNYCGGPSANFLAFNERSVGFFNGDRAIQGRYMEAHKKFIIVSNTENAVFDQAMRQQIKTVPDVIYMKTGKYGVRSIAGDLMENEAAQTDLKAFLQSNPV